MGNRILWHKDLLEQLSRELRNVADAKALILTGSLAMDAPLVDAWSDVDVKVILSDKAVAEFFLSMGWLEALGVIVGLERHDEPQAKTLRVCFEPMRRMDITLIPESVVANAAAWEGDLIGRPRAVIWSKSPRLEEYLEAVPPGPAFKGATCSTVFDMADAFWFKASVAVAKLMRRDVLVACHLTFDLLRDCLVLQMMRRDREKGTTARRTRGYGNEIIGRLWPGIRTHSPAEMLDTIERCGEVFDELAADLLPTYSPRAPRAFPAIQHARVLCARAGSGDTSAEADPEQPGGARPIPR